MAVKISESTNIDAVQLQEQASDPSTPASGYGKLYAKSTGAHFIDDGGGVHHLPSRVLIDEQTADGSSGTISFTSIPAIYNHLFILLIARSSYSSGADNLYMWINGDTTSTNYRYTRHYASSNAHDKATGDGSVMIDIPGNTALANSAISAKIYIPFYKDTVFSKEIISESTQRRDASTQHEMIFSCGMQWESTNAINRVDFILANGNFVSGSKIMLYGEY